MKAARAGLAALLSVFLVASAGSAANKTVGGTASTYGPGYEGYLALPEGPGHRVEICSRDSGSLRWLTRVSNDAGPALHMQRRGRIADLDVSDFEYLCRCSWQTGLIKVTVEYLGQKAAEPGPRLTLPPTDTGGVQMNEDTAAPGIHSLARDDYLVMLYWATMTLIGMVAGLVVS